MTTPEDPYPWLPIEAVLDHLGTAEGSPNVAAVDRARRAAARWVERQRRDLAGAGVDGAFLADDDVVEAGILGAARLYARKGSPAGLAAYAEFATAVLSYDPDVERLLGIGRYGTMEVG